MLRTESPLNFDMVVKMDPQTNICMCCLKCSLLPSLHATAPPQRNGLLPPLVRCYLFSHAIAIFTKPALPACECSSDRAQSLLTSLPRWRGWQRSVDPLLSFQLFVGNHVLIAPWKSGWNVRSGEESGKGLHLCQMKTLQCGCSGVTPIPARKPCPCAITKSYKLVTAVSGFSLALELREQQ